MKKKLHVPILLLANFFITVFLLCLPSISNAYDGPSYHVLVLHSYNKGLPWTDNILKGIESAFEPIADQVQLKVEYMDSKIVKFDEEFKRRLYDLYKHKYNSSKFDVIISSDDNALVFLRQYHKDLFSDTPIVFCGVNNIKAPDIIERNQFTGILEVSAELETLELILKLHPNTKKVVVICDNTPSGNSRWKQMERIFNDYPQLQFSRIDSSFSMIEIEEKMKKLSNDTIAIFATLYRDKSEQFFPLKKGVVRISSASKRPIYTYHNQVLRHGTIGGKVLGGIQHGQQAADMARRLLNGEKTINIPIMTKSLAQYMFNYKELKRFGIDPSELPKESIIINQPYSFYKGHIILVWATSLSTLFLILIIIALQLNIFKRKQVERSLINSEIKLLDKEEQIRLLLNSTAEAIYGLDLNGCCTFCNPACLRFLGYEREVELLGKRIHDLIHHTKSDGTDYPITECKIKHVINNKEGIHTTEHLLWKADGTSFWTESWSYPVIKNGKIIGAVVTFIDISARKKEQEENEKLNKQLQQAHKMEAIGTLAGGIAHDFNNILTAIIGYSEMVKEEIPELKQAKQDIDEVLKAGKRAKELVRHILTFSRKSEQARVPVAIHLIARDALKLLRASIPSTIEIKQDIDFNCGTVLADPTQIHQVLINISTNAAQAMEEKGGTLKITLSCLELFEKDLQKEPNLKPGQYVKLTLSDNGPGIGKDHIERIFDPFYTTKDIGKGTGMGLAVVHGIIKRHEGMITVDSTPGNSTTFNVFLPIVDEEFQLEPEEKASLPTGNERILIVDDEVSVVEMTKHRLERLGYKVTPKTDSLAALKLFRSQPNDFDLIITDQTMPNMTGEQLANELISIKSNIPIIICTGYSTKIDAEKASFLGIKAFIMKPVEKMELARTIRQVLDGVV